VTSISGVSRASGHRITRGEFRPQGANLDRERGNVSVGRSLGLLLDLAHLVDQP